MEVFEKVGENKDLMFKALTRRALSQKELKNYREALEDVNQALQLFPNDNQAQVLKKEIQSFL
jgi:tetratricopeptide (TPR) repeat protein